MPKIHILCYFVCLFHSPCWLCCNSEPMGIGWSPFKHSLLPTNKNNHCDSFQSINVIMWHLIRATHLTCCAFFSARLWMQEAGSRQTSNRALLPPVDGGLREWVVPQLVVRLVARLLPHGQQRGGSEGPGALQGQRQTMRPTPLEERHRLRLPGERCRPRQLGLQRRQAQSQRLQSCEGQFQRWAGMKHEAVVTISCSFKAVFYSDEKRKIL